MSFETTAGTIRAWVDGWVVSRGAADPVDRKWGFTVDVGQVPHATRHVLTADDEATVRKVAAEVGVDRALGHISRAGALPQLGD